MSDSKSHRVYHAADHRTGTGITPKFHSNVWCTRTSTKGRAQKLNEKVRNKSKRFESMEGIRVKRAFEKKEFERVFEKNNGR